MLDVVAPHRRAGVHPADRRRRGAHRRRRRRAAARRRRQGRRQHRRDRPAGAAARDCPTGSARSASCCPSTPAPCPKASRRRRRAGRSPPTAAGAAPGSTRSSGPRAAPELGVGEILLNSMDADGTKAGFDLTMIAAVRAAVHVPVIASGGAGAVEHFAPAVAGRRRRGARRERVPLRGADDRPGQGRDARGRDRGPMS